MHRLNIKHQQLFAHSRTLRPPKTGAASSQDKVQPDKPSVEPQHHSPTFRSSLSTSAACSVFCSRRSRWMSRIHATRRTYGQGLLLRSIPGSLSDLSIREVNKKSLPPLLSPSAGASFRWRLLLDNLLSKSRLLCLVNLEPITPERMRRWRTRKRRRRMRRW